MRPTKCATVAADHCCNQLASAGCVSFTVRTPNE